MASARLAAIYRYPVKSMMGESLDSTQLITNGIPGDRAWAVRDEVRGGIRGGKKIPGLMRLSARYPTEPDGTASSTAEITLSDGSTIGTRDDAVNASLSADLNHAVSLWPLMPADLLDHYRRGAPDHEDFEQELREIFARTPDEPLPDISAFPPELLEYESPPGTYFDAFPLLIMTRQTLDTMQARQPESQFDLRRFRPNLLLDDPGSGSDFPEQAWSGKRMKLGGTILKAEMVCPRCAMTTHGFADLPKDPTIMRALVRENEGNLGLYASVEQTGQVSLGDTLVLLD